MICSVSPPHEGMTDLPLMVPNDCIDEESVTQSYQHYYTRYKTYFARWTKRRVPKWFLPYVKTTEEQNSFYREQRRKRKKVEKLAKRRTVDDLQALDTEHVARARTGKRVKRQNTNSIKK